MQEKVDKNASSTGITPNSLESNKTGLKIKVDLNIVQVWRQCFSKFSSQLSIRAEEGEYVGLDLRSI